MKKNLITTLLITIPVLIFSLVYAQTVNISFSPTDSSGHLICKTTTTIRVEISEPVDSVTARYRKRGATEYQLVGTTTTYTGNYTYSIEWNISNLTNKEYYDVQIEVKSGNSTSFLYTWVQVDRNPRVEVIEIKYSTSTTGVFSTPVYYNYNGYYYLRNGYLRVKLQFTDCTGSTVTMKTDTRPDTKLIIGTRPLTFTTTYDWDTSNTWLGIAEISSDVPNGYATLEITGAKSSDDYTMEPFSKEMFIIDTVQPTVVEVKVDEDGDGNFTDNNGYLNLGETGKVYVWFSEYLTPQPTAYLKINDKPEIGLGNITWINPIIIGGNLYGNYGYFTLPQITNLMGEGEATIKIHPYPTAKDFAGNYLETKTITYKVDAIPPVPPIVYTPTTSTTVPQNLPIEVGIYDPTDTDIKYVEFKNNLYTIEDFDKPYKVYLPAYSPITVTVYDKADNYSQTQVYFSITPEVDKLPPKARITSVSDLLPSTLQAKVNANDVAEVKFQYSVDKTSWTDIYTDYTPSPWQATWDVRNLKDGIYYLRAVSKDINNNIDPNPTITTVEKYPYGVRIEQDSADFDPPARISSKLVLDDNKQPKQVNIKVTSKYKPYLNVEFYNIYNQLVYAIPSTEFLPLSTSISFTTSVPLDVIKSTGGWVLVSAFVVDENNCFYSVDVSKIEIFPVDPQKNLTLTSVIISTGALTSKNTLILEKTYDVPPADEGLVILQAYNLSWTNPVNRFNKDVTIRFNYSTVNDLYQYSTADYNKFTICTWDGKKWITDKDMSGLTKTAAYTRVNTKHSSYFALVADYSKPKIEKFDIVGRTFFGKVTDTGSGIKDITVTVNNEDCSASSHGKYNPETGDFYITVTTLPNVGTYPYTFTVTDNVGNKTERTGYFNYTKEFLTKDIHNYPNPFDPDKEVTNIQLAIGEPVDEQVTLTIFDFNGEVVYRKEEWYPPTGIYEIPWDGRDSNGNKVANGVYFGRIEIGDYKSDYFKIAVLRKK